MKLKVGDRVKQLIFNSPHEDPHATITKIEEDEDKWRIYHKHEKENRIVNISFSKRNDELLYFEIVERIETSILKDFLRRTHEKRED